MSTPLTKEAKLSITNFSKAARKNLVKQMEEFELYQGVLLNEIGRLEEEVVYRDRMLVRSYKRNDKLRAKLPGRVVREKFPTIGYKDAYIGTQDESFCRKVMKRYLAGVDYDADGVSAGCGYVNDFGATLASKMREASQVIGDATRFSDRGKPCPITIYSDGKNCESIAFVWDDADVPPSKLVHVRIVP